MHVLTTIRRFRLNLLYIKLQCLITLYISFRLNLYSSSQVVVVNLPLSSLAWIHITTLPFLANSELHLVLVL